MKRPSTKSAKIQRLLDAATTDGEREACRQALRRLHGRLSGDVGAEDAFVAEMEQWLASREPISGTWFRMIRRFASEQLDALGYEYRWNPSEDTYTPAPLEITKVDAAAAEPGEGGSP